MRTDVLVVSLSLLLASSAGCGVVDDDAQTDDSAALTTSSEVARVTTSDGTSWRFLESEPGVLYVWAVSPESSRAWSEIDFDRLSYVDVYRRLTSAPVPRPLLDAQARADAQLGDRDPSSDDGGLVNEAGGSLKGGTTAEISAAAFQNNYCWFGFDYVYCWPSFYGSPYVQRKAFSLHGHVAAVNNTVTFRLRYKKTASSSWKTSISAQALPGQVHYVYGKYFGYKRWRRFEVLDNGNNLVRYSASGTE
jgi:hypothetical protein